MKKNNVKIIIGLFDILLHQYEKLPLIQFKD